MAHYRGLLDHLLGHADSAEEHFAEALDLQERLRSPILIAQTQAAWAALLTDRAGHDDRCRARELAQSALGVAATGGYGHIEADARAVLERLG